MASSVMPAAPPHIVRLDAMHFHRPDISPSYPHIYTEYPSTLPSETAQRIHPATIIITTRVPLQASHLSAATTPHLRLVCVMAIGTDMIDLDACRARGIVVCNVPAASNEAVAEHAFSLFFALRRRIVELDAVVKGGGMWKENGTCVRVFGGVPGSWSSEVVGIIGGGDLGTRMSTIAKALGMSVLLAERKGIEGPKIRSGRVSFIETLRSCTALMLACPLTAETSSMIGETELHLMRPDAILVNVTRGGIVFEETLLQALKEKRIAGAATDVFLEEPAHVGNSVLVKQGNDVPNLIMSPHVAWYARSSIEKLRRTTQVTIEAWFEGRELNPVI